MKKLLLPFFAITLAVIGCNNSENSETLKPKPVEEKHSETLFRFVPSEESGIDFKNSFTEEEKLKFFNFEYFFNGGGVGIADFNNDGLNDVFFSGNEVNNRLYLNKGNLKFEDISTKAKISIPNKWTNGVCIVDINNDGYKDIYLSHGGDMPTELRANSLLINNGDLTFTEQALEYGIADTGWTTQSIFFDFDNDQDLDLYVLNHNNAWIENSKLNRSTFEDSRYSEDKFYINNNGSFIESSIDVGLVLEQYGGYGLGVSAGDINQDGFQDLYISNDYASPDFFYINQGNGTFKEEVKKRTKHIPLFSMGNEMADYNNDGLLDILTLDMSAEDHERIKTQMGAMSTENFYNLIEYGLPYQYMYNVLNINNGNGTFSDVGQLAGIASTDWSWAPLLADFDNDGHKDLFVTNGYRYDSRDNDFVRSIAKRFPQGKENETKENQALILQSSPSTPLANYIFKNNGDLTFSKKTYEWGMEKKGYSQGAAYGDLDGDGDLDLIMNNINDFAWVYENKSESLANNFVNIDLSNTTDGEKSGAVINVTAGNLKQTIHYQPCRGYMSTSSEKLHFGLGAYDSTVIAEVLWSDGTATSQQLELNQTNSIKKINNTKRESQKTPSLFKDITKESGIEFIHKENDFNDFEKEILLPHRNSMHGPGIASGDINNDGLEDVFIGGAHKQSGAIYLQTNTGKFRKMPTPFLDKDKAHEDLGALFYDYDGDGDMDLYVSSGGNEFEEGSELYTDRLYENKGKNNFIKTTDVLPKMLISGKSVSTADFDGDGDNDLFIGGRLTPGKYPFAPRSYLLKYQNGKYIDVTESLATDLVKPGLVTNSMWFDVDNDKDLDLFVVGEWMPLMLLINDNGKFEWNQSTNISEQVGWWSGLNAHDYDQDGDMDILIGNLGLNYKYKASKEEPFQIWCHDFDESGNLDIVLGYYDHGTCYPVRGRQCSSEQMPFIKDKFPTYNDFASANINDVYGNKLNNALNYKATNFSSIYLENTGNGQFKIVQLPNYAQLSLITCIKNMDLDNDNQPEVLLAGNLFTAEVETPRADASIGMVLKMNSSKKWETWNYSKTGLYVSGDTKGAVIINSKQRQPILIISKNNTQPQVLSIVK